MAQHHVRKKRRLVRLYSPEDIAEEELPPEAQRDTSEATLAPLDFDESAGDSLPSDTLAGLQLLRSQFPQSAQVSVPLLLRSQIYSLVLDHTDVDQELDRLRMVNTIRSFKLHGAIDDYCYTLTEDYLLYVNKLLQDPAAQAADEAATKSVQASCAAEIGSRQQLAEALHWFRHGVIAHCKEIQISQPDLLRLLGLQSRKDGVEVTHQHVQLLLSTGLLMRHSSGGFLFGIPGAGAVITAVTAVRKELTGMLRRRRYPELPLKELEQKRLQGSRLGMQFHVRDMIGRGLIKVLDAPAGKMVQLVKHGR